MGCYLRLPVIERHFYSLVLLPVGGFKVCPNDDMETLEDIRVLLLSPVGHVAFRATNVKYYILERNHLTY